MIKAMPGFELANFLICHSSILAKALSETTRGDFPIVKA
jgi:hypothetical protein